MKGSNTQKNKEDHLAPTKIKQDNAPDGVKAEKHLSDKEVQERLDLYSKGSPEQFFNVQKIKKKYIEKMREENAKRSQADLHYAHGRRSGLPHAPHETIKDTREMADQNFRDEIVKEAKAEYRNHENLTKQFDKENTGENGTEQPSNTEQKKAKTYNNPGKLMGEYKAVQNAKNKAVDQLKQAQSNAKNIPSVVKFKPDQESIEQEQKSLRKYFKEHKSTPQEVRKTFKKIKGKNNDRER